MSARATGTFTVAMKPLSDPDETPGTKVGRLSLAKTFAGDLVATSTGEMLTAMTETKGSAGYVAIERVTGMLGGRAGSFVFQHSSVMDRGVPTQSIRVVPDSGSGELAGLAGSFVIEMVEKQHHYVFENTLPD